jgi:hypothetical protein
MDETTQADEIKIPENSTIDHVTLGIGNKTQITTGISWYDTMKRLTGWESATDDIKKYNEMKRRRVGAAIFFVLLLSLMFGLAFFLYIRMKHAVELERNKRLLAEETRSFNSKYTPILGDE